MTPPHGAVIQFNCDVNETVEYSSNAEGNNLFTKHLMKSIGRKNVDIRDIFQSVVDGVYEKSNRKQRPLTMNALPQDRQVYLNYEGESPAFHCLHQIDIIELFSSRLIDMHFGIPLSTKVELYGVLD
jgi:hypothetical protein